MTEIADWAKRRRSSLGDRAKRSHPKRTVKQALVADKRRIADLLERDRLDRQFEDRRKDALDRIAHGGVNDPELTSLRPTPEWLAKGEAREVNAAPDTRTPFASERKPKTFRRTGDRLTKLWNAGVLCDDRFLACRFYRDKFEQSGLVGSYAASQYGANPGGDTAFGFTPKTQREIEARQIFRFCQDVLDDRHAKGFNYVVLDGLSMEDAARLWKVNERTIRMAVRLGALRLYQELSAHNILPKSAAPTPDIA